MDEGFVEDMLSMLEPEEKCDLLQYAWAERKE